MSQFRKMIEIVPEGASGDATVEHFDVSRTASLMSALRPREYVPEGRYASLRVGGQLVMTDTFYEHSTNYEVVVKARGHVFIAGLGLGMILHPIVEKSEVLSVIVIEENRGVIDLIAPTLPGDKVSIVEGDVFKFKPAPGLKFDCIYFDIWPGITTDNLPEMSKLHRRYRRALNPGGWMGSWCRDRLRRQHRRDLREERRRLW